MKKVVLDTNCYSALMKGDTAVKSIIERANIVYLSAIVLGELYDGFLGGNRNKENRTLLERFLERPNCQILPVTADTSEIFATIKQNLKKSGSPIPLNDVWIAAHSLETGSLLVTYDAHFRNVSNLLVWDELPPLA